MTTLYMAGNHGHAKRVIERWDWENKPLNILVAFTYLSAQTMASRGTKLMLDSGAYSAWTKGETVDIDALIEEAKLPKWDEAVGLDVIGDWQGSKRNAEYTLKNGGVASLKLMPVFHIGDPWDLLSWYCERWPKVGVSCRFGEPVKDSMRFYDQCFARAWPHKFHSFGWISDKALKENPFHSADASSWLASNQYRSFKIRGRGGFIQEKISVSGQGPMVAGLLMGLHHCYDLGVQLAHRWRSTLAQLDSTPWKGIAA